MFSLRSETLSDDVNWHENYVTIYKNSGYLGSTVLDFSLFFKTLKNIEISQKVVRKQ